MAKYVNADNLLFEIKTGWWPQSTEYTNAIGILERMLTDAPAEDVEPVVHGWWEPHPHAYGFKRCSVCHDCNVWGEWTDGKKWNYCPNCGAHMDEEVTE